MLGVIEKYGFLLSNADIEPISLTHSTYTVYKDALLSADTCACLLSILTEGLFAGRATRY